MHKLEVVYCAQSFFELGKSWAMSAAYEFGGTWTPQEHQGSISLNVYDKSGKLRARVIVDDAKYTNAAWYDRIH